MNKIKFLHLVRRSHLYLALICIPWFLMYGITSLAFNHSDWFQKKGGGIEWEAVNSWPCTVEMPEEVHREDLQPLLDLAGMEDRKIFGGGRRGDSVNVYFPGFWKMERMEYRLSDGTLTHYQADKRLQHILTGMHVRGRYTHDSFLADFWAVFVDLTAFGFLLWVITGIILWIKIKPMRFWGGVSLGAGCLSFILFLIFL